MGKDFYKGDKKKAKKSQQPTNQSFTSSAPIFVLPKVIEKKKPGNA